MSTESSLGAQMIEPDSKSEHEESTPPTGEPELDGLLDTLLSGSGAASGPGAAKSKLVSETAKPKPAAGIAKPAGGATWPGAGPSKSKAGGGPANPKPPRGSTKPQRGGSGSARRTVPHG